VGKTTLATISPRTKTPRKTERENAFHIPHTMIMGRAMKNPIKTGISIPDMAKVYPEQGFDANGTYDGRGRPSHRCFGYPHFPFFDCPSKIRPEIGGLGALPDIFPWDKNSSKPFSLRLYDGRGRPSHRCFWLPHFPFLTAPSRIKSETGGLGVSPDNKSYKTRNCLILWR